MSEKEMRTKQVLIYYCSRSSFGFAVSRSLRRLISDDLICDRVWGINSYVVEPRGTSYAKQEALLVVLTKGILPIRLCETTTKHNSVTKERSRPRRNVKFPLPFAAEACRVKTRQSKAANRCFKSKWIALQFYSVSLFAARRISHAKEPPATLECLSEDAHLLRKRLITASFRLRQ